VCGVTIRFISPIYIYIFFVITSILRSREFYCFCVVFILKCITYIFYYTRYNVLTSISPVFLVYIYFVVFAFSVFFLNNADLNIGILCPALSLPILIVQPCSFIILCIDLLISLISGFI